MPADPKARFLQYVGAETDGGKRPEGKGYITERQRQNLNPAYLDYLVQRNKKKNHYPAGADMLETESSDSQPSQAGPYLTGSAQKY